MNRTKLKIRPAYIILVLAVLTYIFQIVIFLTNENNYAYDAQYVTEMAVDHVYRHMQDWQKIYLMNNPNNLGIVYVASLFVRLGRMLGVNGLTIMRLFGMMLTVVAAVIVGIFLDRTGASPVVSVMGFLLTAFLVCMHPGATVPYTDVYSVVFPILAAWMFNRIRSHKIFGFGEFFGIMVVVAIGILIKPTNIFMAVSICMLELAGWICKRISWEEMSKCMLAVLLAMVVYLCFKSAILDQFDYHYNERYEKTWTHYAMMGLNVESNGKYNVADDDYTNSYVTKETKEAANIAMIGKRLKELGPVGYMKLVASKTRESYGDGFYGAVFWRGHSDMKWKNVRTALWIAVMLLSLLALFMGNPYYRGAGEVMLELCCLMYFIYLTVFEAGARYLYHYAPVYILLGMIGVQKLINWITKRDCRVVAAYKIPGVDGHKDYTLELIQLIFMILWLIFIGESAHFSWGYPAFFALAVLCGYGDWRVNGRNYRTRIRPFIRMMIETVSLIGACGVCFTNWNIFIGINPIDEILKGIVVLWGGFFVIKNIIYYVFGFVRGIIITKKSR